tara:strand:+ start:70 stop:252 length:183 start_codon:yes stop_codon:yes gene_type:complete
VGVPNSSAILSNNFVFTLQTLLIYCNEKILYPYLIKKQLKVKFVTTLKTFLKFSFINFVL